MVGGQVDSPAGYIIRLPLKDDARFLANAGFFVGSFRCNLTRSVCEASMPSQT